MKNNKRCTVRIREQDYNFCRTMAEDVGWTVSRYIRYLIESEAAIVEFNKEFENGNIKTSVNDLLQHEGVSYKGT